MLDQSADAVARRLLVATIHGTALRHAGWEPPAEAQADAAVAELRAILGGRDDGPSLLAEVAGILIGAHEGRLDEFRARVAASFCIAAGADEFAG